MRLKIIAFLIFFNLSFAGLNIYDLSGIVVECCVNINHMKYAGDQRIVCWRDSDGNNKNHCRASLWNGTTFDSYDVSGPVDCVRYLDYTINSSGQAVVVWVDGCDFPQIKCSIWNGSSWNTTVLSNSSILISSIPLVEDSSGNIALAWRCQNGEFSYFLEGAYWNGSSWLVQTLESPASVNFFTLSACIDNNGMAAINWLATEMGGIMGHLKVASWNGGGP